MPKAIRIYETGSPDVMRWEDVNVGQPGPGQILIRHTAIGLNYIDIYHRSGLYPMQLPSGLGSEAAGLVEAVGAGVKNVKEGDRVAYAGGPIGAYAERRLFPAERVVKLPKAIKDKVAAAMMLKGMTAEYLLRRTYKVRKGETILVHAAAGGVGLILCQWAKHLGATVIGTVSTKEKAREAKANGCAFPIVTGTDDFVVKVKEITKGSGVPVVYDSVGRDTFQRSLDCLQPLGLMVSYGNSSGPLPPINTGDLVSRGSLFFTRPTLGSYVAKRRDLEASADALFDVVAKGKVKIRINQNYALKDAAQAHRDLQARKTTGSTVLLP